MTTERQAEMTTEIPVERIAWHGQELCFKRCGEGPPVVLVHGIAGSFETWNKVIPLLARNHTVIAPDLPGHGLAPKGRGDYSLGAFANAIRDLLVALDVGPSTVIGHSMGGGIALQFAYQYPELCSRLGLIASGGLGPEVTPLLRAATLPGSEIVIRAITSRRVESVTKGTWSRLKRLGLPLPAAAETIGRHLLALRDAEARHAFVTTARSVMDLRGQRIDATDRLYLAEALPILIVWGARDGFIPVEHARRAHELIPHSRLEIFDRCGHFPQEQEPERLCYVVNEFLDATEPAALTLTEMRAKALGRAATA